MWQELKLKDMIQQSYRTYLDCMVNTKNKKTYNFKLGIDKNFLNPKILVSILMNIIY